METITKKDENFRNLASKAARNYNDNNKWSSFEKEVKTILEEMGFEIEKDYLHNFKVSNPSQSSYFELDFFFPQKRLVLEVDGTPWHSHVGDADIKDRVRETWLSLLGWETIIITSKDFKEDKVKDSLEEILG